MRPGIIRAVTNLDVTDRPVDLAIERIPRALSPRRAAAPTA